MIYIKIIDTISIAIIINEIYKNFFKPSIVFNSKGKILFKISGDKSKQPQIKEIIK